MSLKSRGSTYESDFEDEAYVNMIAPSVEDSTDRIDVERFIFTLPLNESIVLVFSSMGYSRDEIRKLLGYRRVQSINQMFMKLRHLYLKNNLLG